MNKFEIFLSLVYEGQVGQGTSVSHLVSHMLQYENNFSPKTPFFLIFIWFKL